MWRRRPEDEWEVVVVNGGAEVVLAMSLRELTADVVDKGAVVVVVVVLEEVVVDVQLAVRMLAGHDPAPSPMLTFPL